MGITVAAELRGHDHHDALDIAIVEPSVTHYYQPGFTLVGAGAYDLAKARRAESRLIPAGVSLIHGAASARAGKHSVTLDSGDTVTYEYLVVCPGVNLDWANIDGCLRPSARTAYAAIIRPGRGLYLAARPGSQTGCQVLFTQPRCRSSAPARRRRSPI